MSEPNDTKHEAQNTDVPVESDESPDTESESRETPRTSESTETSPAEDGHPESVVREGDSEEIAVETEVPPNSPGTDGTVEEELDELFLSPEESESEVVEDVASARPEGIEVVDASATRELEERLETLEKERDDYKNRMLRLAADLENFRKRNAREKEEMRKYGSDKVILELLPVLDNLERALEHTENVAEQNSITDGVRMVFKQFVGALQKHGVVGFEAKGEKFDPQRHEAIQQTETSEEETGTVLEQYQKGYFLHDRLIRPALVNVAKRVEATDNDGQDDSQTNERDERSELAEKTVTDDQSSHDFSEEEQDGSLASGDDASPETSDEASESSPEEESSESSEQ